jgi:hypothetical protein
MSSNEPPEEGIWDRIIENIQLDLYTPTAYEAEFIASQLKRCGQFDDDRELSDMKIDVERLNGLIYSDKQRKVIYGIQNNMDTDMEIDRIMAKDD